MHNNKNIIILTDIRFVKNLSYQLIFFIKDKAIVFLILLIIIFMSDQIG